MKKKNDVSFEKVERNSNSSFSVIAYSNAFFAAPLHIHPEYELILIEEGDGLTFVGDAVRKMTPGDFMLIGRNLPHLWLSAEGYYEKDTRLVSRSVYTQFNSDIFPAELHSVPELVEIYQLLKGSQRGLLFSGDRLEEQKVRFRKLVEADGFEKWAGLCDLLYRLATECRADYLTSGLYEDADGHNDRIITRANEFMNRNYQSSITLKDIATYAGMNASALCRHYKRNTGKTVFCHLSSLRISYAAKLLMNKNISISQVAYDCGYNSLSHFNHQFKNIVGQTPSDYCKKLVKVLGGQ